MITVNDIQRKIKERTAKIGVIGLGYVGLPLAVEFAKAGFQVVGIDTSRKKVEAIQRGENYIQDISEKTFTAVVQKKLLSATSSFSQLKEIDCVFICVPTPLGKGKDPDVSYILSALDGIKKYLHKGQVVVLESTTYPGTTEEILLPILESSGLKVGHDFCLAFSPERIDPGNKQYNVTNTPKIVGGVSPICSDIVKDLYKTIVDEIVTVSSPRTAEMVKLLENTFRAINIGLANEIAIMCNHLNINTWEVIEAAATKPFGFMPFYPGPGLGGHCIPIDPHYLVWKLKLMNYHAKFISLADEINSNMPKFVVDKIVSALNNKQKSIKGSKILVLGAAYKKDIDDSRESPSLDVIKLLKNKGANVAYNDPYIPTLSIGEDRLTTVPLTGNLDKYDCITILTDHSSYNFPEIVEQAQLIVDTRNATRSINGTLGEKIVRI